MGAPAPNGSARGWTTVRERTIDVNKFMSKGPSRIELAIAGVVIVIGLVIIIAALGNR